LPLKPSPTPLTLITIGLWWLQRFICQQMMAVTTVRIWWPVRLDLPPQLWGKWNDDRDEENYSCILILKSKVRQNHNN
jgi:hypothetical protein